MPDPSHQPAFLGVERSVNARRWVDRLDDQGQRRALTIAQTAELPDILARVLAARMPADAAPDDFLEPTLRALMPDPSTLADMDAAAARIADAIMAGETLGLFGDYDVDGATSIALFVRFLRALGSAPIFHIPNRMFEGYGPNTPALDAMIDQGATLIVTLDCGTAGVEPLGAATARGVDVIVIDHHQEGAERPDVLALVNPNRHDDLSGLGALAAVGVTFMTLVAVNRALRERGGQTVPQADMMGWLGLCALGTVCDVVPLTGLNRAFVRRGLDVMARRALPGLRELCDIARLSGPPSTYHLGFMLGPRINAGGRIGDARLGATLLLSDDDAEATRIAAELDRLNAERQAMEAAMLEEAIALTERHYGESPQAGALIVGGAEWHKGVVGILAARLKERFQCPACVISFDEAGEGTASGRSVPGVDLGRAVHDAVEAGVLEKGGGHAMAAGFTIRAEKLDQFRAFMEDAIGDTARTLAETATLSVDAALTGQGASATIVQALERAGPYGAGNPEPLFVLPAHSVRGAKIVGAGGHVRCALHDGAGARVNAIAFRAGDSPLGQALMAADRPLHVAGHLQIDRWGGRESVQLLVRDAAIPARN